MHRQAPTLALARRSCDLHFKNLTTGKHYAEVIAAVTGNLAWANDNRTLFYSRQDPQTLRPCRIYRHVLGTDPAEDALVYEETGATFSTYVRKTKSRRYLVIGCYQMLSTEHRILSAGDPTGEFQIFCPRQEEHEYFVDHLDEKFYVRTNWQARNFRLMETSTAATQRDSWREVIPHRPEVLLEQVELFRDYLVLQERLFATAADGTRILLHTSLEAGHGGASGRFERYRETALAYAFLLDLVGIEE